MIRHLMLVSLFSLSCWGFAQPAINWQVLEEGLAYAEYAAVPKPAIGNGVISILRINPTQYQFELLSAKYEGGTRTADQWAEQYDLVAAVNTGMYLADYETNLGFMQHYDRINNPRVNKDNTIAAFNPKTTGFPPFQIIDRSCQDWPTLKEQYHSFTQSIRMVDCHGTNRWGQQSRQWSMVILGEDKAGNCLFIFTRSPFSVHDFIDLLLSLPIDLAKAMYLEGGPEASFYLKAGGVHKTRFGSYETDFWEDDSNDRYWAIPNVIGVKRRE